MSIFRGDKKVLNSHLKVAKVALDAKNYEDAFVALRKSLDFGETYQVLSFAGFAAFHLERVRVVCDGI